MLLGVMSRRWSSKFGDGVPGVFTPVLAKHSKSFSLVDAGLSRILNDAMKALQRCLA